MNLISCDHCATVYDANKLKFPEDIFDDEGYVKIALGAYSSRLRGCVPYVTCPVCQNEILKED